MHLYYIRKDKPWEKFKKMYVRVLKTLEYLEITATMESSDLPRNFE